MMNAIEELTRALEDTRREHDRLLKAAEEALRLLAQDATMAAASKLETAVALCSHKQTGESSQPILNKDGR